MSRTRLGLIAGFATVAAIVAYLSIPGHPLGTFFFNLFPPIFRETVRWEQQTNALQQVNGQILWQEIQNHLNVTLVSSALAIGICFPLGVIASRFRPVRSVATNVVGVARAVPGVAVIFLMYPFLGQGEVPGALALTLLAAPPIFLNTVAGYAGVDVAVVESARGMGMNRMQIFGRIQSPLAAPVVLAGIRIALVEIIASATILPFSANYETLGAQIGYGLDDPGNAVHGHAELFAGVTLVASMALIAELALTLVQRAVAPVRR